MRQIDSNPVELAVDQRGDGPQYDADDEPATVTPDAMAASLQLPTSFHTESTACFVQIVSLCDERF
jgi:hypothetical protein